MLNSALYRRKSETHEQCIGEKVKLYDLKKEEAKNANAVDRRCGSKHILN